MKTRGKIVLGFVALALLFPVLLLSMGDRAERDLQRMRRALQQQGFKTDLREFDLSSPPEIRCRAALLGTTTWPPRGNRETPKPILQNVPVTLLAAGSDAGVVVWKLERLRSQGSADLWPELRETLNADRERLESACQAALSGPIRFEPIDQGPSALLPYLADLKKLSTTFAVRTLLALHDGDKEGAWTNLLACTCLVTAYEPEPIDVSQLVRLSCTAIAYDTLWNALQFGDWTDTQLAELQRRWETIDFWSRLPETAAYSRAGMAATCELERRERLAWGITWNEALHSPAVVWYALPNYYRRMRYLSQGSYEDQKAVLLYYRDRELQLRSAIRATTWSEMRQLPGVTNSVPFRSLYISRVGSLINMRQMTLGFQAQGQGLVARAADSEARRRLMITAIALERYRALHTVYPHSLQELVPEVLKTLPVDFMDGKPLRYRLTPDGHFVLYSVGLDCVDDGGAMPSPNGLMMAGEPPPRFGFPIGTDLVWPRPASAAEVGLLQQENLKAEAQRKEKLDETQASAHWTHTMRRQAQVETILTTTPPATTNEPTYGGQPLAEVLYNQRPSGPTKPTLAELLTLKQVLTGSEPEIATFELPINFDALTNLGGLHLYIDPCEDNDSDAGCEAEQLECNRATDGNCLLIWHTIYECPGRHVLQAGLFVEESSKSGEDISGPLLPFVVSNLCQFSPSSAYFDRDFGATFRAKLPEPNGACTLEIRSPNGPPLKTMAGATTNGLITLHWNLKDEHGNACTNDSFDTVFHISLPASGRSQTLNGP